ncbi:TadE/TadG family type IV pilus assembly protein [Aurantiacibacter poecillastricola]|uniref:TadE/TadG family type IV pilus assembly protein n=1 Tax=Aurantiacibacter poecillastricola TaxID=3064385 RepID=UPI00273F0F83|nr:TadE family protein [Aurantiacibacter sp. 219JJ12-13]MDP5262077.1 pilus assembly protein [Aurantiacibacter sp. 219JJ12-13]
MLTASKLAVQERGVTTVEFALIAPVLLLTLMGLFDLSYNFYAKTMIEGTVQNAARDSTIEQYANNPDALDAAVESQVRKVVPSAVVAFSRKAYVDYSDVGQAEEFTDTNGDGVCNNNEAFEDVNGNDMWDSDRSLDATSGARDAVLYEVTATYDRAFPLARLVEFDPEVTVSARTVLRNQPFNLQKASVSVGNCA